MKSAEKRGVGSTGQGFDGGKTIKGKKRHVLVDTQGLLIARPSSMRPTCRTAMAVVLMIGDACPSG